MREEEKRTLRENEDLEYILYRGENKRDIRRACSTWEQVHRGQENTRFYVKNKDIERHKERK